MRISDWSSDVCSSDLDQVPKGGDFAGGGDAQALQRRAAGPVDGLGLGDFVRQMVCRQGSLGEVVDLLASVPRCDRQMAAAPEVFTIRLCRMPVTPERKSVV